MIKSTEDLTADSKISRTLKASSRDKATADE